MRKSFGIFLLVAMSIVVVNSDEIDSSHECLVNYLREQNLDDEFFSSVPRVLPLSDSCKRRISSEMDSVFIVAHQNYERKDEFKNYFDCFMDSIRNNATFKHLLLKKKAVESTKLTWKARLNPSNWISNRKRKVLKTVESDISAIEFENLFLCEYDRKFGSFFESFFVPKASSEDSNVDVICMRSHLAKANVKSSPGLLDCSEVLNRIKSEIYLGIQELYADKKKSERKCLSSLLTAEDIFTPTMRAQTFARNYQGYDKEQEMKIYVESMKKTFRGPLIACTRK